MVGCCHCCVLAHKLHCNWCPRSATLGIYQYIHSILFLDLHPSPYLWLRVEYCLLLASIGIRRGFAFIHSSKNTRLGIGSSSDNTICVYLSNSLPFLLGFHIIIYSIKSPNLYSSLLLSNSTFKKAKGSSSDIEYLWLHSIFYTKLYFLNFKIQSAEQIIIIWKWCQRL